MLSKLQEASFMYACIISKLDKGVERRGGVKCEFLAVVTKSSIVCVVRVRTSTCVDVTF